MLFFAVVMVVLALVLYTVAIWAHVISRKLHRWMVFLFAVAFLCDIAGTIAMSSLKSGFSWSLHGIIAWAALLLMAAMFVALLVAYYE